jgi:hypothetical protein
MVLADLGRKLNAALSSLNRAPLVDEKVGFKCCSFYMPLNLSLSRFWMLL